MNAISILGIFTYCTVGGLAAFAAIRAYHSPSPHSRGDTAIWALVALVFVLFALARYFAVEDAIRADMRAYLIKEGEYGGRRHVQGWMVGILMVLASLVCAWLWRYRTAGVRLTLRRLSVIAAIVATLAFIVLFVLRIISLHAVDRLLYGGPIHMNWLFEAGLCAIVALAAVVHSVKRRSGANHGRKVR